MWNKTGLLILVFCLFSQPSFSANVIHVTQGASTSALNANQHGYIALSGISNIRTTEARMQVKVSSVGGTFSGLNTYVSVNSATAAVVIVFRKNGGDGTQTVSIPSTSTGLFQDTTHSDTISAADLVNWDIVTASDFADSATIKYIHTAFAAATNSVEKLVATTSSYSQNAATAYITLNGSNSTAMTTEGFAQQKFRTGGTLSKGMIYVNANGRSGFTTTYTTRINAGNASISIAVAASATGLFEDTTHSDAVVATDLVNWGVLGGAEATTLTGDVLAVEFTTTDLTAQMINGNQVTAGSVKTAASTNYLIPGTGNAVQNTTESLQQVKTSYAFTASNLNVSVTTNLGDTNGTLDLRQDTGGGPGSSALTVAITALTTGWFEDTTHSVSVASGDLIDFRFVAGNTGNTTIGSIGMVTTETATASSTHRFFNLF